MLSALKLTTYSCPKCGWADFHPATRCPKCNNEINTSTIAGEGKIATFTTIRYPPKGFENLAPYVVALVDLKAGLRVIGRVKTSANDAAIGSAVSLVSNKGGVLEFELAE